ncbi:MAG: 5'/3'-nucleotidase SurE [Bacteroidetes bacterium]|nr:5'/3'-nucleotidase SurE [Bacteroidota bacterium]
MRILVTNDDGMAAPGIKALVEVAREFGQVIVVAPDSPQSAQGHAITISDPIRLHQVDIFKGIESYECSGTPVDCVKLAKHVVLKDRQIDLCLSGINHGSNSSINIIYSGTMSAAMEASIEGIPSIGFSLLDYSWDADFGPAKSVARELIKKVIDQGLNGCSLLNVNIPKIPETGIMGMKVCRQAEANWKEEFMEAKDPRGQKYYWLTGEFVASDMEPDTDLWALQNGYVSIVPSGHDLTVHNAIGQNKGLESEV